MNGNRTPVVGFTLVEVMVVLLIITLLALLVTPGVTTGLERARRQQCATNQRSIGVALMLYAGDNDGRLPPNAHKVIRGRIRLPVGDQSPLDLVYSLEPYLQRVPLGDGRYDFPDLICPAHAGLGGNPVRTYCNKAGPAISWGETWEERGVGKSLSHLDVAAMSGIGWLTDNDRWTYGPSFPYDPVHNGGRNWLFFDGSVQYSREWLGRPNRARP